MAGSRTGARKVFEPWYYACVRIRICRVQHAASCNFCSIEPRELALNRYLEIHNVQLIKTYDHFTYETVLKGVWMMHHAYATAMRALAKKYAQGIASPGMLDPWIVLVHTVEKHSGVLPRLP